MMRLVSRISALVAVTLLASNVFAQQPLHARVSFSDSSALVKGADDEEWSFATVNALVLPGDTLWADQKGVLEVEFSQGTFLRMADGSRIEVKGLPPTGLIEATSGSFYVQRVARSSGEFVFETPVARIELAPNTQVRFDVVADGATTVSVRWGRAIVHTPTGDPVIVDQGRRTYIDPGYLPSAPLPFDLGESDALDGWNRERARLLAVGTENVPIIENQRRYDVLGVSDLNTYGQWLYDDGDYYWRPTAIADYVPYRYGYWSHTYGHGYGWVGHYPFSYITSHYGYWHHHHRHGWIWRYDGHYSPAHVVALRYGDLFVWTAADIFGHPVRHGNIGFAAGDLHFSFGATSFSHARDLLHGGGLVHSFGYNELNHTDDITIWNIHLNGAGGGRRTNPVSTLPTRTFRPTRSVRGPSINTARIGNARQRAEALEARTRVATVNLGPLRNVRRERTSTVRNDHAQRVAQVRDIRLARSTDTTMTLTRALRSSNETRNLINRRAGSLSASNSTQGAQVRPLPGRNRTEWTPSSNRSVRSARSTSAALSSGAAVNPRSTPNAASSRTGSSNVPSKPRVRETRGVERAFAPQIDRPEPSSVRPSGRVRVNSTVRRPEANATEVDTVRRTERRSPIQFRTPNNTTNRRPQSSLTQRADARRNSTTRPQATRTRETLAPSSTRVTRRAPSAPGTRSLRAPSSSTRMRAPSASAPPRIRSSGGTASRISTPSRSSRSAPSRSSIAPRSSNRGGAAINRRSPGRSSRPSSLGARSSRGGASNRSITRGGSSSSGPSRSRIRR